MSNTGSLPSMPVAATMDLQYRLPPFQQILFTPTIIVSLALLLLALALILFLSYRSRIRAKREARREALRMAEKILRKRGGGEQDVERVLFIFEHYPDIDPATMVMVRDRFHDELRPLLDKTYDPEFGERMEKIYFPPPKDTRRAIKQTQSVNALVEEQKQITAGQTAAAILDLMDATLKPGVIVRLTFEDVEGGYECLVMGHDMNAINVTLPANNDQLVGSLHSGLRVEGTLESGPSLLAFTSSIIQAVAGSMPYCRIAAWKSAWEIRKRDSLRLPISLDVDFQHISTAAAGSIKMSTLNKEIGAIRPGRLIDVSLGGCCLETPSAAVFREGDMVRFSKSLVTGNPPATLLGALVKIDPIDPALNEGSKQRLHVQFLVIDDVSQRILVRTLRELQDVRDKEEWMQAQQLLQRMRRNRVENIGSPSGPSLPRRDSTGIAKTSGGSGKPGTRTIKRSSTRMYPRTGTVKPATTSLKPVTKSMKPVHPRPSSSRDRPTPPPGP